jgi:uncharacterized RDD family membrane protein YckC
MSRDRRDETRTTPVALEDRLAIATPEGVEVELVLAGIGSRFIAGAVDYTLQLIVIVAMAVILQPSAGAAAAVFTSASFALIFFYDVLFEVLGGGRTPGKRLNGLRVVRSGGRPITFSRSALRNILRLIDILPGVYAIGMTVIFITPGNQRVGDLAAGTHVIRERHGDRAKVGQSFVPPVDPEAARTWDVTAISADEVATVRAFLERRPQLRAESRQAIAGELASRLRTRVGGAPADVGDERFLELLVAVKGASRR